MGPAPRLQPMPSARPVHAGRLAGWERLAFALVFALMMAFVVVITISSARAHGQGGAGGPAGSPSSAARPRPGGR